MSHWSSGSRCNGTGPIRSQYEISQVGMRVSRTYLRNLGSVNRNLGLAAQASSGVNHIDQMSSTE